MRCKDVRSRLDTFVDAELDPQFANAIAAHLDTCPSCRTEHESLTQLKNTLRSGGRWPMPEDMERKILDSVDQARQSVPKATAPGNRGWWPFAAGLAAGVLASIGLNWSVLQPAAISASLTDNLITAHVDSQIADHFIDFVSSDQHSVKPWFNGKVDYAVPVKDLSASGFILIGGRLDFISGKTVAVVAYQYRKHNVNLFVWPEQYWPHWRTGDESRRGYTLLSWDRDGFSYYLVSDLNPRELGRFRTLFEAAQ